MSGAGFRDHFSASAAGYAAFRPTYPPALFDFVLGLQPGRALAWDAGTGNGQTALELAHHFDRVAATDASSAQIKHATPHPRIAYAVGRAESSGLADASCDLVTVSQALHWFDIPAFLAEAARVLKPRGAVAAWGYADPALDDPVCDAVLQQYLGAVNAYWPPERALVDARYRGIPFPFDEVEAPTLELELHPTRAEFAGYVRTWSASLRYREAMGGDPVEAVEAGLRPQWPDGERRRLHWPLFMRAGRNI